MSALNHIESNETLYIKNKNGSLQPVTIGGYIPKLQRYEVTYSFDGGVEVTALVPYKVLAVYNTTKVASVRDPEHQAGNTPTTVSL